MSNSIENTLVLCDLDNLLLNAEGSLPQLHRDVLQLFASRGGKLTIYSQRSPKVVRSLLGGVRLSAPALVCGGVLAYNFAEGTGTALCSFAGMEESVLRVLPGVPGVGIALQMKNGSTRVLRMSESLEAHLRQEWTTFVLSNAADVRGEDVLRILFYQDNKQVPLTALLEKALGEATVTLRAERMGPGCAGASAGQCVRQCDGPGRLLPGRLFCRAADRSGRLHPDGRAGPSGGEQRRPRRCPG